ncbi:MAG: response regulator transcription factor [Nitrospirae bacterium]|nr:response regulator transcription factor [Nitrospirota bacterium]MBU6482161.1 response regulator transcription factor [Nitrospirota bacterium]MDE3042186.1 response regulator transcription factor [Nitrospirota bacterium]MDE3218505.1 response regulator transcription factor [Nitrospirota bacterium]
MAIRVLLADDHALVRQGIRSLLEKLDDVEVVGEVGDGRKALELSKTIQPDIVFMDITMPGLNGLEAVIRMKKECPATRVIMLSMHAGEEYFQQALDSGAAGYLLKDADRMELELAIRTVMRGDTYLTPTVAKYAVEAYRQRKEGDQGPLASLSSRQKEILQLIAEGYANKEIAQRLDLSPRTVETHRAELMERLNIRDVPGLVKLALRAGLIKPGQ